MGIFATKNTVERHQERLDALYVKVLDLERANRSLQLEYEELYDKVRRQMARMSKRVAVDAKEANDAPIADAGGGDGGVDQISANILARRGFLRRQAE